MGGNDGVVQVDRIDEQIEQTDALGIEFAAPELRQVAQYDVAGRVRRGPAPQNLAVPPYTYLTPTRIKIG